MVITRATASWSKAKKSMCSSRRRKREDAVVQVARQLSQTGGSGRVDEEGATPSALANIKDNGFSTKRGKQYVRALVKTIAFAQTDVKLSGFLTEELATSKLLQPHPQLQPLLSGSVRIPQQQPAMEGGETPSEKPTTNGGMDSVNITIAQTEP